MTAKEKLHRKHVNELREQGLSYGQIADELGIAKSTAWNYINQQESSTNDEEHAGTGFQENVRTLKDEQNELLEQRNELQAQILEQKKTLAKLKSKESELFSREKNIVELEEENKRKQEELNSTAEKIAAADNQNKVAGRKLLFEFRDIVTCYVEGTWDWDNINDLLNQTESISGKIEEYCFVNEIKFDELSIKNTLDRLTDFLVSLLDQMEEEGCDEYIVEFPDDIKELINRTPELDFGRKWHEFYHTKKRRRKWRRRP